MKSLSDGKGDMRRFFERMAAQYGIEIDWSVLEREAGERTAADIIRELYAVPEGACPYCGGRGWWTDGLAPDESGAHGDYAPTRRYCDRCDIGREAFRKALAIRVGNAQLPPLYADAKWSDFRNLPEHLLTGKLAALYAASEFVEKNGIVSMQAVYERGKRQWEQGEDAVKRHLVIFGPPSMGKTTLLAVVVNALLKQDRVVLYQRLPDLLETIAQTYGSEDTNAAAEIERQIITAPYLMLDEFEVAGYQSANGLVSTNKINIVERLMRSRMYDNRPTLITTNLDKAGMQKRWGLQIAAVLEREAHWIKMDGEPLSNGGKSVEWETW